MSKKGKHAQGRAEKEQRRANDKSQMHVQETGTKNNKRANKKQKRKRGYLKKIIFNLIFIAFLACAIFSGYKIYMWVMENQENEIIKEEVETAIVEGSSNDDYNVDFNKLKQTNEDTVAWIKINGTAIEYPIVQADNNDYYLKHSFNKTSNSAGWIFADYRNKMDGTDTNIIVYGHNRRNGSMFSSLRNILQKEWYENESNRKITFITETGKYTYDTFAVYELPKDDYDTTTSFSSSEQFLEYVQKAKERSVYDFNVDVSENDTILTVSTCGNNNDYRVVLQAKKNIEQ